MIDNFATVMNGIKKGNFSEEEQLEAKTNLFGFLELLMDIERKENEDDWYDCPDAKSESVWYNKSWKVQSIYARPISSSLLPVRGKRIL